MSDLIKKRDPIINGLQETHLKYDIESLKVKEQKNRAHAKINHMKPE